jgi:hypothetical protein
MTRHGSSSGWADQAAGRHCVRGVARRALVAIALVVALYLVVRGIAEVFVVDFDDPASYRSDWGGPSLIGVLAVHSGPGLVIAVAGVLWLVRHRRRRSRARPNGAPRLRSEQ